MSRVDVDVDRHDDHLLVRWSDSRSSGSGRFDRIPGTAPEWLASADDLLEGAGRKQEGPVLDAIGAWATTARLELGIWHDGGGVELLT